MRQWIWRQMKVVRRIAVGPVALAMRFERRTHISRGLLLPARLPRRPKGTDTFQTNSASDRAGSEAQIPSRPGTAVIVGTGPGFGHALARTLVAAGFDLVLVARNASRLDLLVKELAASGQGVAAMGCDVTDERSVVELFRRIESIFGTPALVVYSVEDFGPGRVLDVAAEAFERAWRHNCLGSFLVAQSAGHLMRTAGRGTLILIGSTSAVIGREDHLCLSVGKFGQRALSQVLARELWPEGIHVAHVMIDADIAEDAASGATHAQSDPAHIADSVLAIHRQRRTAWSSEIDLRPWNEKFWQHC